MCLFRQRQQQELRTEGRCVAVIARVVVVQEETESRGWVMVDPVGHRGESRFYSQCGRMPRATEEFKERVTVVYFFKISLADAWRWIERKQKIEVGSSFGDVTVMWPREEGGWTESQQTC